MSVETEKVENEQDSILDDIAHVVVTEPAIKDEDDGIDADKMAALKARLAAKNEADKPPVQEEPIKEEEMPPRILEQRTRSLEFGVVGSGQAGSRLAETFYKLGYDALAFNTALQDLQNIGIPDSNKIFLDYSLGGASKDQTIGHEAAQLHRDLIYSTIADKLGDAQVFVFCTSLGGGSGGGSIETMIDIMSSMGKPIVVITVLPMTNEGAQTKKNSLEALSRLAKEVQNNRVQNLIVVDNAKIEYIFKDVGPMQFYKVSNEAIVEPLDVFNTFSVKDSDVKGLDPMEFTKILMDGRGRRLYGSMTVTGWEE